MCVCVCVFVCVCMIICARFFLTFLKLSPDPEIDEVNKILLISLMKYDYTKYQPINLRTFQL